jgi:hypothetical protein
MRKQVLCFLAGAVLGLAALCFLAFSASVVEAEPVPVEAPVLQLGRFDGKLYVRARIDGQWQPWQNLPESGVRIGVSVRGGPWRPMEQHSPERAAGNGGG